jgi:dipeptidyl aminopeptidase/acylaminoacyl peptidase
MSKIFETSTSVKLVPRRVLFGNPVKAGPTISPDGTKLAFLAPLNGVLNVWIRDLKTNGEKAITSDTDRGIRSYFWAHDHEHLLYLQDKAGDENWRLFSIHLKNKTVRDLTPFSDVQTQIVDRDKHFPNELLIALNKDNPKCHDVYHLNLKNGELKKITDNPGDIADWVIDAQMKVRGAVRATPDAGYELLLRDNDSSPWKLFLKWELEDTLTSHPLGFTLDGQSLYLMDSRKNNTGRLIQINLQTQASVVIAQDHDYDVSGALIHPDSLLIQAVCFMKARNEWTVLDPTIAEDFSRIKALHKGDFTITSRNHADTLWTVAFTVDDGPVVYFLYDRKTRKGTFLFENQPELKEYTLSQMHPITLKSRDGLTLHGYLTYPASQERKNLPMVLNVHGGPNVRDTWGYDPEAQWLANRGYACLQLNYRGSTGYGKAFVNAADKEWGGKMHDDLVDAVQWAIQEGIADPKRVAIYGGSYGGYAALVGATFTPDLFCCAVDIVGPSNLITMIRSIPPYWSTYLAIEHKRVGNPDTEEAFLKSRSPLFKVDQIKRPILIAHGKNDPRVKLAESEQIIAAMKKNHIPYEFMLFEDEGHGFAKPENRMKFYAAAEKFLAQHVGGLFEP